MTEPTGFDWKRYVPDAQENAPLALFTLVGSVWSAKEFFGLFVPDPLIAPIFIITVLFTGRAIWRQEKRLRKFPPLPSKLGTFRPFRPRSDDSSLVWPRTEQVNHILSALDQSSGSHLVFTGRSGAGKSIITRYLLPQALAGKSQQAINLIASDAVLRDLLTELPCPVHLQPLRRQVIGRCETLAGTPLPNWRGMFDLLEHAEDDRDSNAHALSIAVDDLLRKILMGAPTITIIFDQSERILRSQDLLADTSSADDNGYWIYLLIHALRTLRECENVRTVFVARAEYLYNSLDFLDRLGGEYEISHGGSHFTYVLCPGVNPSSDESAMPHVRADFDKVAARSEHLRVYTSDLLSSQTYANTFMLQLVGYLLEHFPERDDILGALEPSRGPERALCFFFSCLLCGYGRERRRNDAEEILKIICMTIATENRVTARSISVRRISALSHLPEGEVSSGVDYLRKFGLLSWDSSENATGFRFVHEIIIDFILDEGQITVSPSLKEAVRFLSERRAPDSSLTPSRYFANPLSDWRRGPDPALISLWMFYIFGAAKSVIPGGCQAADSLLHRLPLTGDCAFVGSVYIPVYVMHVLWVSFIYLLDKNYLRYVLKGRALKGMSATMAVLGAAMGVLFSQSPILFLIPIVSVGLLLGVILLLGSINGSFQGIERKENIGWGMRTFTNMLLAASISLATALVLWREPAAVAFWVEVDSRIRPVLKLVPILNRATLGALWMYAACGVMIYFWWHIRPSQQAELTLTEKLAIHDQARMGVVA